MSPAGQVGHALQRLFVNHQEAAEVAAATATAKTPAEAATKPTAKGITA